MAYYNEISGFCCRVLRARIVDGRLPAGTVDERDVREVRPADIPAGQVHLFAGIGGFGLAARLARLPDDFDIWTAGFPCQDISSAGRGAGLHGARSGLFFEIVRLLHGVRRRPLFLLLENVSALRTRGYDRVRAELEEAGYAVRAGVVGAWAVGAPHRRNRVWIVAHRQERDGGLPVQSGESQQACPEPERCCEGLADAERDGGREQEPGRETDRRVAAGGAGEGVADAESRGLGADGGARDTGHADERGADMADAEGQREREPDNAPCTEPRSDTRQDAGGRGWPSRPGEPQHEWEAPRLLELPMGGLADGLPVRLVRAQNRDALKAYGNSIVPQVAAAVMRAMIDAGGRA